MGDRGQALEPVGEGEPGARGDMGIQARLVGNQEHLNPSKVPGRGRLRVRVLPHPVVWVLKSVRFDDAQVVN